MRKYVIERHFIKGLETFEAYRNGIGSINAAIDISRTRGYGLEFGLKLTVDGKVGKEMQESIRSEMARLPATTWLLYDPEDRGAGASYRQVLFNPTFAGCVVANADLDQYVIDERGALEQMRGFLDKVERDDALYANGSRDVPVVLATYRRNSDLRIIHELFHSLAIGERLRVKGRIPNEITPAYADIGESTSGFYVINQAHPSFPELVRGVTKASQVADFRGFATDYYTAIKSSLLGNLATGYVRSRENKFYVKRDEQQELEGVKGLISGQTRELGKTDIRRLLQSALEEPENAATISGFYPAGDVELVRELMLDGLDSWMH
ncbi:MAG: hypothetical protein HY518_02830 [Candidatus Aenigmarchaeota archaeon]|nr:hypothetical protein [Candidatus Aenigmarchaeota archaeon]